MTLAPAIALFGVSRWSEPMIQLGIGVEDADAMRGDMEVSGQLTCGIAFEFERGGMFSLQPEVARLEIVDARDLVPIAGENREGSLG